MVTEQMEQWAENKHKAEEQLNKKLNRFTSSDISRVSYESALKLFWDIMNVHKNDLPISDFNGDSKHFFKHDLTFDQYHMLRAYQLELEAEAKRHGFKVASLTTNGDGGNILIRILKDQ